jgi:hypothetical protein
MSEPKKHHYVPQFLLRLFADDRGRLLIHRTDRVASYPASVRDVGHTNLGHSLFWPSREPDHVTLEQGMSQIEGAAAEVIKTLRSTTARTVSESQREVLGFLISLQWARSRFLLTTVRRSVTGDVPVDDSNRSAGLLPILMNVLGPWWARARDEFDPKERFSYVVDWLQYGPWTWRLYRPTSAKLVVADNLVCMWGVADGQTSDMPTAWTHHGVALGFGNCARITMPLAPDLGLIIAREPYTNRRLSASDFNRATVFNSREFVALPPDGLADDPLRRALDDDIQTQRWILPIIWGATLSAADKEAHEFAALPDPFDPFDGVDG